ncbi:hypothetical protein [Listeria booriae]|uniref:hypothetical protein n=1 Tax=Listeria booriae TaxID=1552123 RepID=UPI001624726D|nr:hypothetical protein [Listeria booriae]MBC2149485.1 hypothetical protein [Listeria booriae]
MEQKIELTNEVYLELNRKVDETAQSVDELKKEQGDMRSDLNRIKGNRILDEDTLGMIMEKAVRKGVSGVLETIADQDRRIRELEIEKYKTAHSAWKWVILAAGGTGITFIVTSFIQAIVN